MICVPPDGGADHVRRTEAAPGVAVRFVGANAVSSGIASTEFEGVLVATAVSADTRK